VSAISASSLAGGRLVLAYLLGPRADVPKIYGIANGAISLPNPAIPTAGVIHGGCKMESTITNSFVQNNTLTLILDADIASFSTSVAIADAIDSLNQAGLGAGAGASDTMVDARAIDQLHVQVSVPIAYRDDPVKFVSLLLDLPLPNIKKSKSVVINEREGVIVMGEDVLINPVAINHKNLAIEAKPDAAGFIGIDVESPNMVRPKLKNLVEALNALKVPTEDVIAIIRTLKSNGDLYADLIIK
jgi:flagellar P-ring protein FlgI